MLKCLKILACIIQKLINQSFIRDNKKNSQKLLSVHERTCFTEHKNFYMKKKKHALVKENSTIFKN